MTSLLGRLFSHLSHAMAEINPATLCGAMDVIVVEQADGSLRSSPFHVRFGKLGKFLKSRETIVDICLNGEPIDVHMKLAESGVAYFLEDCEDEEEEEDSEVKESIDQQNIASSLKNTTEKELDSLVASKYGLELETDLALSTNSTNGSNGNGDTKEDQKDQSEQPPPSSTSSSSTITSLDEETKSILITSPAKKISQIKENSSEAEQSKSRTKYYRQVLHLPSDLLQSLPLQPNVNALSFSITTAFQGTTTVTSKLYLWGASARVVISDIDGTITRSDLLGHVLPRLGHPWAQVGVTQLFTDIAQNGYHFLYLSARAIGQARRTRAYLGALKQEEVGLPEGPVLLSPTSVFFALHREVIIKKPEEFKIACLKEIQALFPGWENRNPFFAGFGNRETDNLTYKAVGIEPSRIFTINHKGEVKLEKIGATFKSSYTDLSQFVDPMFPPLPGALHSRFRSFMVWRPQVSVIKDDDNDGGGGGGNGEEDEDDEEEGYKEETLSTGSLGI